jgi:DNA-binding Lrp family transcriptional regulator
MMQAYILIQTEPGSAVAVTGQAALIPGVIEADTLSGYYDVILHVQAATVAELGTLVETRIGAVAGITRRLVCWREVTGA